MNSDKVKIIKEFPRTLSRVFAVFFMFLFGMGMLNAQGNTRELAYQAYISSRIEDWGELINDMMKIEHELDQNQLLELIGYYYGYIGWEIEEDLKKKAKENLSDAEAILEGLLEKYSDMPELYAFKGAFVGFRIGLNSIKAVVLGPESMKNINLSIEIGPEKSQPWIEKGNMLSNMPAMFGGSKEEAIEAYTKAIGLMEKDPMMTSGNWMYLNVLVILGKTYEQTENWKMAKSTYEKALRVEPDFSYVRDELYPALIRSSEKKSSD